MVMGVGSPPIKVVLIGAGEIVCDVHIPVLKRLPQFRITGIYDQNQTLMEQVASRFEIGRIYSSYEDVLADEIDVVDICTPPQTHAALVAQAVLASKNCFVEKPYVLKVAEADEIQIALSSSSARVFPIQNYSYVPAINKARRIISSGKIGRVANLTIRYSASFDDHRHGHFLSVGHWVHSLQGDVFSDLTPHVAYLIAEFLGHPNEVKTLLGNSSSAPNVIGDQLEVLVASDEGLGFFTLLYGSPAKLVVLDFIGTSGTLHVDFNSQAVVRLRAVRDSRNPFSRGREALSEVAQLITSIFVVGSKYIVKRYTPVTYGHEYLFRRCYENMTSGTPYPVDMKTLRDSIELCDAIYSQLPPRK